MSFVSFSFNPPSKVHTPLSMLISGCKKYLLTIVTIKDVLWGQENLKNFCVFFSALYCMLSAIAKSSSKEMLMEKVSFSLPAFDTLFHILLCKTIVSNRMPPRKNFREVCKVSLNSNKNSPRFARLP